MDNEYFAFLENVFKDGYLFTTHLDEDPAQTESFRFANQSIGLLTIKSGRVGVADPFQPDEYIPFEGVFPTGEFPVELAIVRFDEDGDDERVAFARIVFSQQPTERWEVAVRESADADPTYFAVDSATAGFFDAAVSEKIAQIERDDEDWFEDIESAMDQVYADTRSWYLFPVDDLNIAFFSAGVGDGDYRAYVGTDAHGEKTQLVADFGLFSSDPSDQA